MFTQVLQRQPVHKAASFAALCTAARRWQSKRACVNMLIFLFLNHLNRTILVLMRQPTFMFF